MLHARPSRPLRGDGTAMIALSSSTMGQHLTIKFDEILDKPAQQVIAGWLAKRPAVMNISGRCLGETIVRYRQINAHQHTPRNELFLTKVPGLLLAGLTIHPAIEHLCQGTISPEAIAGHIKDPPLGLLTGIWQSSNGYSYLEHCGHIHLASAQNHWITLSVPGFSPNKPIRMIGRQADGQVYFHNGEHIWRAEGTHVREFAQLLFPTGSKPRIDAQGKIRLIHDHALLTVDSTQHLQPIELWRINPDTHGLELSPASPTDILPLPGSESALILDDKGRIYHASLNQQSVIQAQRVKLPTQLSQGEGWVVTAMGLARDNSVHLLLQDTNGRRLSAQAFADVLHFHPAYLVDRPLLLMHTQGLHAPPEGAIQAKIDIDGHAQIGHLDGVLHYRIDGDHPWDLVTDTQGEPVTGVHALTANPMGFIDRRGVFALINQAQEVVELKLEGRATWLAADTALSRHPSGGPLAMVPDKVQIRLVGLTKSSAPIQTMAVFADRTVALITTTGQLALADHNGLATSLPPLENPVGLAVGLDDQLYVLHRPSRQDAQLKRLTAEQTWATVRVELPSPMWIANIHASRAGQILLQLNDGWHTLLPAMTAPDGQLYPQWVSRDRVPEPNPGVKIPSGTNHRINQRQASRISTPHHDLGVTTTLFGTTSTDPLTLHSNLSVVAHNSGSQAKSLIQNVLGAAVVHGVRSTAHQLGIPLPPDAQQRRLAPWHHQAQQAYDIGNELFKEIPSMAVACLKNSIGHSSHAVPGLTRSQIQSLLAVREQTLEKILRDLRKIAFHEGLVGADFGFIDGDKTTTSTTSTPTYWVAEQWRQLRCQSQDLLSKAKLRGQEDMLIPLSQCFQHLAQASTVHPEGVSLREAQLLSVLVELSTVLSNKKVHLPPDDGSLHGTYANARHGLRTAVLVASFAKYHALLQVRDEQALTDVSGHHPLAKLLSLADLGVSSWYQLAAFDDVVTTFRQQILTPGTARRAQLLKSMGLPNDASADEMASRMGDLLQDLFNRSTFFSIQTRSAEIRGGLGLNAWKLFNSVSVGLSGDSIHALGVERIGDSKDADAGLVAFFVRHDKAGVSGSPSIGIDFKPGPGGAAISYATNHTGASATANCGGAGIASMGATFQHGQGAAVILAPHTINEFARLLFDLHDKDTTRVLRTGVNGGAIGLDLFETNFNLSAGVSVNLNPVVLSQPHGPQLPSDKSQTTSTRHPPAVTAPRSNLSALLNHATVGQMGAHWGQMELHLDHAWKNIIGLEFQGRTDLNAELNSSFNVASTLSSVLGRQYKGLIKALTSAGNLQLAGIRIGSADVQLPTDTCFSDQHRGPFFGTSGYKRTLDTEASQPISQSDWEKMVERIHAVFPESEHEFAHLPFPKGPSERVEILNHLIGRIESRQAQDIEKNGVFEGPGLQFQRFHASQAMSASPVWQAPSAIARAEVVEMLTMLRQSEERAWQYRACIIPGARVEFNLFGREALETVVSHAIGHLGLGSKLGELDQIKHKIPGLDAVLRVMQAIPKVNQVRFVCEMRPQARFAINDALMMRDRLRALRFDDAPPTASSIDWSTVLEKVRTSPDLYRLAVIAVHNTDDNPTSTRVGLPLVNLATAGGSPHQVFSAELQFRYGLFDTLQGAEVLEAGSRALDLSLKPLLKSHVQAIGQRAAAGEVAFGPPSPRSGEQKQLSSQLGSPRLREQFRQRAHELQRQQTDHFSTFQLSYAMANYELDQLLQKLPQLQLSQSKSIDLVPEIQEEWPAQQALDQLEQDTKLLEARADAMRRCEPIDQLPLPPGMLQDRSWERLRTVEQHHYALSQTIDLMTRSMEKACLQIIAHLKEITPTIEAIVQQRVDLLNRSLSEQSPTEAPRVGHRLDQLQDVHARLRRNLFGEQQALKAINERLEHAWNTAAKSNWLFLQADTQATWRPEAKLQPSAR